MKTSTLVVITLVILLLPPPDLRADRFVTGQSADVVLGQPDFISDDTGNGAVKFDLPWGIALDPATGKVFIADYFNHRVLRFSSAAAATTGGSAEAVLGQPDFVSVSQNQGGAASAHTLRQPTGLHLDSNGRLWVADSRNNRVLCWVGASYADTNAPADLVFGQPNFTTITEGNGAAEMRSPQGVFCEGGTRLWVSDRENSRVLRFDDISHKASGAHADGVLGHGGFGSSATATSNLGMNSPEGIHVDAAGRLWVADSYNHRVLRFDAAASKANGAAANGVLGQPGFTSNAVTLSAKGMRFPTGVLATSDGTVWVADAEHHRVLGFRAAAAKANGAAADLALGQTSFTTDTFAATSRSLFYPYSLGLGPRGTLFVGDANNSRVLRFSPVKSPLITAVSAPRSTRAASATVRGRATGPITKVTYRVGKRGPFKRARGTANWSFKANLKPGKNRITILAEGPGGTSRARTVNITRR